VPAKAYAVRPRWVIIGLVVALAALAAVWRVIPLADWRAVATVTSWAQESAMHSWLPILVLGAYTPASLTLFPRPIITLFAVAAFGPWLGFALAFTGIMIAAMATYVLGRGLDPKRARLLDDEKLARLRVVLQRRGVLAVTAVRLVPIAPFAVVNAAAGALRVRVHHFAIGSALGILPGTATATVLGDRIAAALRSPELLDLFLITAALLVLVAATLGARRWLARRWTPR
jgi:phospholipase D1/2